MSQKDNRTPVGASPIEVPAGTDIFPYGMGAAHYRLSWVESKEHKQYRNVRNVLLVFVAVFLLATIFLYVLYMGDQMPRGTGTFSMLATLTIAVCAAVSAQWVHLAKRRVFRDRYLLGQANELAEEDKEVAAKATDGQLDLPSLWAATQTRINYYHDIATSQAEQSFRVSIVAAISGFGAVIVLGVMASFADGTAAIAASVVGVAGAAMSGYIGATFMKTQAQASKQLSQFFLQPVESARLLGAERLLQSLQPEQRAEAVSAIVKSMMTPLGNDGTPRDEPNP